MTDDALPRVSVLTPAYNYERFVVQALQSALAQDYPADRFELVVVDDGSTDGTAAAVRALADRNPGRIKFVTQENAGHVVALGRARDMAEGEILAQLDADDVWLPHKLRTQVEILRQRPEVGLVFHDMRVVDTEGQILRASLYEPWDIEPDRMYARLLQSNLAYGSSIVYRQEHFLPWPAEIDDFDWWAALCAAERSDVAYVAEPLGLYRQHGNNRLNGVAGEKMLPLRRRQLRFQLWAFRHMDLRSLTPADLLRIWTGPEWFVGTAKEAVGTHFVELVTITADDRDQADTERALAAEAAATGALADAARHRFRALAWNPYDPQALAQLRDAVEAASAG